MLKNCEGCGLEYKTYKKNQRFCSKKCSYEYKVLNKSEYSHVYDAVKKVIASGKLDYMYEQRSEAMKIKNPSHDPNIVEKQKASLKKYYLENPDKLKKRLENFINAPMRGRGNEGRKPTKLEKFVIDINSTEIRYTGNGKFWLTFKNGKKKNPDFKVNGKRMVIEVGDTQYWHSMEEIKETVNFYKEIGYDCLYLTDVDINMNPKVSKDRILNFIKQGT